MHLMIPVTKPCVRFQFHRSDYTDGDIVGCTCTCNYYSKRSENPNAQVLKQVVIRCMYRYCSDLQDGFYLTVYRNVNGEVVHSIPYLINSDKLVGSDDYRRKLFRRIIVYSRPFIDYVLTKLNIRQLPDKDVSVIYNALLTKERSKLLSMIGE